MNLQGFTERITQLLHIQAPVIWINTKEEAIAERVLCRLAIKNGCKFVYRTSAVASEQLDPFTAKPVKVNSVQAEEVGNDFFNEQAFAYAPRYRAGLMNLLSEAPTGLGGAPDGVMVIFCLDSSFSRDADQQRFVYEIAQKERKVLDGYMPIVFLAGSAKVPDGILESAVSLELPLMTQEENAVMIAKWLQENNAKIDNKEALMNTAQAATGLTSWQTKQALKDSIERYGKIDPKVINDVRVEVVKQCETLTYLEPKKTLDDIGGHGALKKWIASTKKCMSPEAKKLGVKASKGYVALGQAGTGKTALAEAVANYLGVPLIIFDLSRIMGGIVGQSEQTARRTFEVINSLGKCVVLIDEIDKQLGGIGNNVQNVADGGTLLRVFDVILQNLQNNTEQFYILTANDVQHLPAPLMRSGRIDKKWFFDFPNKQERKDIFKVYIKAAKRMASVDIVDYAAALTEHFTGAEIETVVDNAIRFMFLNNIQAFSKEAIMYGISQVSSIYENNRSEVEELMAYASKNNIPKTSSADSGKKLTEKEESYLDYLGEALERGA